MAFVAGKNSYFQLDDSGGTLRDLSGYLTSLSLSRSLADLATTTLGNSSVTRIVGLADATISISGVYDETQDGYVAGAYNALLAGTNASSSWVIGLSGSGTGKRKLSGECIITAYDDSTSVDGRVEFTATLAVTGAVTTGTF